MNFLFKQAVCFDKKDYSRGVHELSGKSLDSPIFKKFLDIGWIVEQKLSDVAKPLDQTERNMKISEKFESKVPDAEVSEGEVPKKLKKQK